MSWYLANQHEVLDQFASGGGLTALVSASQDYAALKTFFSDGMTKNVDLCANQLHKLASRTEDEDVASTAKGLADLMNGQHFVAITQGFGFEPEHDSEKDDDGPSSDLKESVAVERPFLQRHRDAKLPGAHRKIVKAARDRFRKQRAALLAGHTLQNVFDTLEIVHAREADDEETRKAEMRAEIVPSLASLVSEVPAAPGVKAFDGAITAAVNAGAEGIAQSMGVTAGNTESFIAEYLKDAGFQRLTGELDNTTVDRLASAIADAYEEGADFDGIVSAVKSEFADMTASRAQMIAQTELNDAFNQSVLHFGREAGGVTKTWEVDLNPCIICIANALQGAIPIEDDFESGDDAPPSHPNCQCSILVGAVE